MSNYNVGDMIRLTRQAIGMSQEELCADICSVQTLSRIENGKVAVKRGTYRLLMEKMGRNGSKSYFSLQENNFDMIDVIRKIDVLIWNREFEKAEEYLVQLKQVIREDEILNMQYVNKVESIIDFESGRISKEEHLANLEKAIFLTIPNYNDLLDKMYPFTMTEIHILMNIAEIYGKLDDKKQSILINYMLIRSINSGYMSSKKITLILGYIIHSIARVYGEMGEHQTAINMCQNAIKKARSSHMFLILPTIYGEIARNMMEQIEKGQRDKNDIESCKRLLRQAYATAKLSNQYSMGKAIEELYRDTFQEDGIFSPSSEEKEVFFVSN